ncbi:DUF58 domain-containing protein [Motiliproteus coralliicola]|nr:DUF58 domain-containing protein [Motiliproteus coralliicola]
MTLLGKRLRKQPGGPRRRIRPTANGGLFLVCLLVIFLLAINHSNNLLFTFCFLLGSLLIISFWSNLRNLRGIRGQCAGVEPVHAGQSLRYGVVLQGRDTAKRHQLQLGDQPALLSLQGDQHQRVELSVETRQRGDYPASMLRLSSCWPLGLFQGSVVLCQLPEALVYPRAEQLQELQLRSEGEQAHRRDGTDSLSGLKEYQPGDNLRRVHWRALARNDQLQVKQFDGEEGLPSGWLHWEDTAGLGHEARIRCLTHWVLDSFNRGLEFGLRLPGLRIEPAAGAPQLHRCLSALARIPEAGR